jgi:hypothetical protein
MVNALANSLQAHGTDLVTVLGETSTESGRTLLSVIDERPTLMVFLRHFGCPFCRQALDDVAKIESELARRDMHAVFVHLGTPERAKPYFDYYKLSHVERVSNPDGSLYGHPVFQLKRTNFFQLIRPHIWIAQLVGLIRDHGIGLIREDVFQMPGVFFLRDRAIVNHYRHRTIDDRPDYLALTTK